MCRYRGKGLNLSCWGHDSTHNTREAMSLPFPWMGYREGGCADNFLLTSGAAGHVPRCCMSSPDWILLWHKHNHSEGSPLSRDGNRGHLWFYQKFKVKPAGGVEVWTQVWSSPELGICPSHTTWNTLIIRKPLYSLNPLLNTNSSLEKLVKPSWKPRLWRNVLDELLEHKAI